MKKIIAFITAIGFFLGSFSFASALTLWYLNGTTLKLVDATWSVQLGAFFNNGFTNVGTTTAQAKGDLIVASSTTEWTNLAAGTDGLFLKADSSSALGVTWAASGAQTPWSSAIDGAGYNLTNGGTFTVAGVIATSTVSDSTFERLTVTSATSTNATTTGAVYIGGNLDVVATTTITNDLVLQPNGANYKFTTCGGTCLSLVNQDAGESSILRLFPADGDGTDNSVMRLYGVGTYGSLTNSESMAMGYYSAETDFHISSLASGSGTVRDLALGNTNDLHILTIDGVTNNVGIGNTAPAEKLNVQGETASQWFTATSTTEDNTFPNLISTNSTTTNATSTNFAVTGWVSILGEAFTNFTTYVRSLFTAGTGISISSGEISATLGTSIDAGEITAGAIDGDDVNSNIAGRSLTLTSASPDTLDADAELYTGSITFNVASSTMSTTTSAAQHRFSTAVTITNILGSCNTGTTTVQFEERADATPNTAGTDVLASGLQIGSGFTNSTASFDNATIAAGVPFNFEILDAEPTGSKSTNCSVTVKYTEDD